MSKEVNQYGVVPDAPLKLNRVGSQARGRAHRKLQEALKVATIAFWNDLDMHISQVDAKDYSSKWVMECRSLGDYRGMKQSLEAKRATLLKQAQEEFVLSEADQCGYEFNEPDLVTYESIASQVGVDAKSFQHYITYARHMEEAKVLTVQMRFLSGQKEAIRKRSLMDQPFTLNKLKDDKERLEEVYETVTDMLSDLKLKPGSNKRARAENLPEEAPVVIPPSWGADVDALSDNSHGENSSLASDLARMNVAEVDFEVDFEEDEGDEVMDPVPEANSDNPHL